MNIGSSSDRGRRLLAAVALPLVVLLGAAGCSTAGNQTSSGTTHPAENAKKASTALAAGLKAHAAGDLRAASADYRKTLQYDPTNKYAFYNLALIDEADGNYGLAEGNYRSALKSDPAYEPSLFNLAILRTARNDPKDAISLYERAVAANKKDAAAWLNLGLLLRTNGSQRAGDKDVLRAIALDPKLKDPAKAAPTASPASP
jgi:tetratricopeptide (TPR) repeat protein